MKTYLTPIDIGDVTVIDIVGRLTLGVETGEFRDLIHELRDAGRQKLLLDLTQVSYIDSSGMAELVSAYVTLRKQGGAVKLLNLTKQVRNLLHITKLSTIFEVFEDRSEALRSF